MLDYVRVQQEKHKLFEETKALAEKIYEKYPVGGVLHIVLDDMNLKNHYIQYCREEIETKVPEEDKQLFYKCCDNLLKMTMTQRKKLYYQV